MLFSSVKRFQGYANIMVQQAAYKRGACAEKDGHEVDKQKHIEQHVSAA